MQGEESALARALGRWIRPIGDWTAAREKGTEPGSFEQVTRRGLDDLGRQVDRIETKLNGILFAVGGTILIDLYRTIIK